MPDTFLTAIRDALDEEYNVSVTENGALGYRTSGKALLDLNFAVASLRSVSPDEIARRFADALLETPIPAMKWLFFARDVRGGLGERRLFRSILRSLGVKHPDLLTPLLSLVPEYGRWDDLWCLLDTPLSAQVCKLVSEQLQADLDGKAAGKPISLLAKWMPSVNASSAETKRYARLLRDRLGMNERSYRKLLTALRRYLNIVERRMSAKQWSEIDYEAVPSRANLVYNAAFLRNDEIRRRAYLASLEKGEAKINAGTLYPHDIVHRYTCGYGLGTSDSTLEQLWKALPDTVQGCGNTLVVADGSGSMCSRVGNTGVTALDVANALAIYFSERSSGQFRDQYITFSGRPQLVDLSGGTSLRDKLAIALRHNECANTNIEAVFNLILRTAQMQEMKQEELPKTVLIISDMEFDACAICGADDGWGYPSPHNRPSAKLFKTLENRYMQAGYQLPRLVFWNVNSRTGTIPVKENELGVALVSGFSVNVARMVLSGKLDPYACLLETLNTPRYAPIEEALHSI